MSLLIQERLEIVTEPLYWHNWGTIHITVLILVLLKIRELLLIKNTFKNIRILNMRQYMSAIKWDYVLIVEHSQSHLQNIDVVEDWPKFRPLDLQCVPTKLLLKTRKTIYLRKIFSLLLFLVFYCLFFLEILRNVHNIQNNTLCFHDLKNLSLRLG